MMRFIIYAYESTYGGSHGIYDICVIEANSLDEVEDIAETMSYEVIDSYSHLFEDEDDCDEDYEPTYPEWEYARILPQWDNISTEILDAKAAEIGYKEFVEKYCKIAATSAEKSLDSVGTTVVGRYTIDTCFENNHYETAIWISSNNMAIPAIYPNRAAAERGHKIWCAIVATAPTRAWDTATHTYITL